MNLTQHHLALVTGASSGLGKELCLQLASKGIALILSGRDQPALEALAASLEVKTVVVPADLANPTARKQLIYKIQTLAPDLVINNAGFGLYGDALAHTTSAQQEILEVNGNALLEISLEAARALREKNQKGTVLNVSSAASFFACPTFAVYSATKAFVNQFSLAFDREMRPRGIRILTACPGQIKTPFRIRASSGREQTVSSFAMSVTKAAKEILWQIEKGKRLHIFDARYRLATFIARHFLPEQIAASLITASLKKR